MEKNFYIELIYKSLSSKLSEEEQHQLDNWLDTAPENRKEAEAIQKTWELSANFSKNIEVDLDLDFEQLQQKITQSNTVKDAPIRKLPKRKTNWMPLGIAATLLLLVGAFFMFKSSPESVIDMAMNTQNEVKELVLADGSKVWLNKNSKLEYAQKMEGNQRNFVWHCHGWR